MFQWSPGLNVLLEGAQPNERHLPSRGAQRTADGVQYRVPKLSRKFAENIVWTRQLLEKTSKRPPVFYCFGVHEWAMLYSKDGSPIPAEKRQQHLPLRVPQATINAVVESRPLQCTHFDAFRFFQPEAKPLNSIQHFLTRDQQASHEQPGCIHASMDLFKYCMHLFPFVSSDLLTDALELAIEARIVDMRASPYDLTAFPDLGFQSSPIEVDTASGRRQYALEQERVFARAQPLRQRVIDAYDQVIEQIHSRAAADDVGSSDETAATTMQPAHLEVTVQ